MRSSARASASTFIPAARLIYPRTGPIAGYFYRHPDPPVPVYWLGDIVPTIERAIQN